MGKLIVEVDRDGNAVEPITDDVKTAIIECREPKTYKLHIVDGILSNAGQLPDGLLELARSRLTGRQSSTPCKYTLQ